MKKNNALMGAKARITSLEAALVHTQRQLESTSDACALYARKSDLLERGTESLKSGISELRDVVNEQSGTLDMYYNGMNIAKNTVLELKGTLVKTRIFAVGISLLLVAEIIMKVMGA